MGVGGGVFAFEKTMGFGSINRKTLKIGMQIACMRPRYQSTGITCYRLVIAAHALIYTMQLTKAFVSQNQ